MKRRIISICLLGLFLFGSGPVFAATLSVRADSWPPYNMQPGSSTPGYMIEVLQEIFGGQGITVDYQLMPWNRSIDEVRKGSYSAIIGAAVEDAPDFVFPTAPFGKLNYNFYVKAGSPWRFNGEKSLAEVRIGFIDGYNYGEPVDSYLAKAAAGRVYKATGDDVLPKLLKMLVAGRIDAVIEGDVVMEHTIRELGYKGEIVSAGAGGDASPVYIAFSPTDEDSKEYARLFDQGMATLRQSGKLKVILDQYGLADWQ